MQGDDLVAASRLGDDAEGAADVIGELGGAVEVGAGLDLDADGYEIASGEARS